MKRTMHDHFGRSVVEKAQTDRFGAARPETVCEVASFLDAGADYIDSEETLLREFAEFSSGESDPEQAALPPVDPIFKERLRRRLWRLHVLSRSGSSSEPH